jgi:hypothetical protein
MVLERFGLAQILNGNYSGDLWPHEEIRRRILARVG